MKGIVLFLCLCLRLQALAVVSLFYIVSLSDAFVVSPQQRQQQRARVGVGTIGNNDSFHNKLQMASTVVPPSPDSTVGVVGRGFVSVLSAKLAALMGYNVWLLMPPGQKDTIYDLINVDDENVFQNNNLELVEATDTDRLTKKLKETDAFLISSDDDIMNESVINYILDPKIVGTGTSSSTSSKEKAKVKRVVVMSRNLNGKGMGFFVKASKFSANKQVWDNNSNANNEYKKFEENIRRQTAAVGGDYTIVRAGTLKGGGCGEEPSLNQYLSKKFYELVQTDVVNWQLLFDCVVRGVKITKGDLNEGPGINAVFTAIGTSGGLAGDSSRSAIAEAMVQSLASDKTANIDFGVSTVQSREPPTTDEWQTLFETTL